MFENFVTDTNKDTCRW